MISAGEEWYRVGAGPDFFATALLFRHKLGRFFQIMVKIAFQFVEVRILASLLQGMEQYVCQEQVSRPGERYFLAQYCRFITADGDIVECVFRSPSVLD